MDIGGKILKPKTCLRDIFRSLYLSPPPSIYLSRSLCDDTFNHTQTADAHLISFYIARCSSACATFFCHRSWHFIIYCCQLCMLPLGIAAGISATASSNFEHILNTENRIILRFFFLAFLYLRQTPPKDVYQTVSCLSRAYTKHPHVNRRCKQLSHRDGLY